jgi:hypothetical protein
MNTESSSVGRRQALALAGALTLAVATAVAAIGGIARTPQPAPAAVMTPIAQTAAPAHEVDD